MLAVVQRVARARVEVDAAVVGAIDAGLLLLVCAEPGDGTAQVERLVDKVLKLRVFADAAGRMNRSLVDVGGGLLVVSQFTLAADTSRGHRPAFTGAAPPEQAEPLYNAVLVAARARHPRVAAGVFGAAMQLHVVVDGPVTIPLTVR